MNWIRRIATMFVYAVPPIFAALYAGATEINDGQFWPWQPLMIDLDVYIRTAERVAHGQPFYAIQGDWLPFIYPPIAAILSLPFTLLGTIPTQLWWLVVNALMIMACAYRLGFTGWKLSLVSLASIWLIQPMRVTLGFGQVNIFLMALVFLDLMPGPRVLGSKRWLPEGWMTGLATAIKLTPLIFSLYLFLVGRVRAALVSLASFVVACLIGFAVLPDQSRVFWGRLIHGDSGMNAGMKYFTNQSVMGTYIRFAEIQADKIPLPGLLLASVVGGLGLVAAILWHRLGHAGFGLALTAFAGLFMSPISWSHHFVWVMPLAIVLLTDTKLPEFLRWYGVSFCIWVMYAPFNEFIDGQDEFAYRIGQKLITAGSMIFGIGLFVLAIVLGLIARRRRGLPWLPLTLRAEERGTAAVDAADEPHGGATAVV